MVSGWPLARRGWAVSMTGMVATELLLATNCAGLALQVPPVICIGAFGQSKGLSVSCCGPAPGPVAWMRHSAPMAVGPSTPPGLTLLSHVTVVLPVPQFMDE